MRRGHGEKSDSSLLNILECLLQRFPFLPVGSVSTRDFPLFLEKNVSPTSGLTYFSHKKRDHISPVGYCVDHPEPWCHLFHSVLYSNRIIDYGRQQNNFLWIVTLTFTSRERRNTMLEKHGRKCEECREIYSTRKRLPWQNSSRKPSLFKDIFGLFNCEYLIHIGALIPFTQAKTPGVFDPK